MAVAELSFREGTAGDLAATFALSERAIYDVAVRQGVIPHGATPTETSIRAHWLRQRNMIEFLAAQPGGRYWIAEDGEEVVGFARVVRFGAMEELTELMVDPDRHRTGIGRALLERVWPGDPTPDLGRVVVATGAPPDLTLYPDFGVMPVTGHWHLRVRTERYLERRAQEVDVRDPGTHVLAPARAAAEWQRLEPLAIAHERPALQEFFARDRNCLATMDEDGSATGLCWVSSHGEIGPAVGAEPEDLVPVVLAALDRVAKTQEPEELSIFCTTIAWWLLRRLRGLGFHVYWPSWVMCSVPIPGLDRYVPTRPPHVL
ncbi:MAG TPA: GNAT family N-acetyltransferase [Thermoleophilaceae bacterium]|nr:GNAT family N-acetyltransferase [Thermoleophilaceae bacterium]